MRIAIIGGIGSGKSEVSKIIESFGNLVISADAVYNEISQTSEYLDELNVTFPGAVKDGKMDRAFLGKLVFNNKEEMKKLNAIAHPKVMKKIEELSKDKETVYIEVPVFIGTEFENYFDKVILVESEIKFRISRIIKRSGYDKEYAKKIIASQPSDEELEKFADVIVKNNKDLLALRQALAKVI